MLISADFTIGKESFYVAVSRVKDDLKLYTSDSDELLRKAKESRAKENPLELLRAITREKLEEQHKEGQRKAQNPPKKELVTATVSASPTEETIKENDYDKVEPLETDTPQIHPQQLKSSFSPSPEAKVNVKYQELLDLLEKKKAQQKATEPSKTAKTHSNQPSTTQSTVHPTTHSHLPQKTTPSAPNKSPSPRKQDLTPQTSLDKTQTLDLAQVQQVIKTAKEFLSLQKEKGKAHQYLPNGYTFQLANGTLKIARPTLDGLERILTLQPNGEINHQLDERDCYAISQIQEALDRDKAQRVLRTAQSFLKEKTKGKVYQYEPNGYAFAKNDGLIRIGRPDPTGHHVIFTANLATGEIDHQLEQGDYYAISQVQQALEQEQGLKRGFSRRFSPDKPKSPDRGLGIGD